MFFQPVPGNNSGVSRPFIVGLVMLLLFLSMQTEWTSGGRQRGGAGQSLTLQSGVPSAGDAREAMKEKIILDLSLSNERLERKNTMLKQHVLDLRRTARACGCELNATEAAAAVAYPELGRLLGMSATPPTTAPTAAEAQPPGSSPQHRPERHRLHVPAGQDPVRRRSRRSYRRLLHDGPLPDRLPCSSQLHIR